MHNVRVDPSPALLEKVVELWVTQRVLTDEQAGKRTAELLFVAVDNANDGIAGVCTTYLATPPALRMPLWHFRTFVAPEYRRNDIAFHLLHLARDFHETQYVEGIDTRGRGLYMEIENPIIQRHRNEAVWPSSKMVFIGYNAAGHHCRIHYFPGTRIA